MIVILSHLEVNMKVLSTSMGTMGSDDYRELSGDDGNTNGVLAITWERARFFYKDKQNFINLFI